MAFMIVLMKSDVLSKKQLVVSLAAVITLGTLALYATWWYEETISPGLTVTRVVTKNYTVRGVELFFDKPTIIHVYEHTYPNYSSKKSGVYSIRIVGEDR